MTAFIGKNMTVIVIMEGMIGIKQQNLTHLIVDSISQVYTPFGRLED
ncbi:hypothetical protein [Nodularia spumigena]|nr:hypothetical protein [Nodularia spumigena]MDB9317937.1 hypothetical protein [Nodularia spumigena CS-590/01A]MDB9326099.1 hypothetical protein [Nodularia spumigena CS-590/02]MDB9333381.1 hypothetical protein [Nodularia spumigena CS-590/01]